MRGLLPLALAVSLSAVGAGVAASEPVVEEVTFHCAPVDGERWIERVEEDRTEDFDDRAPLRRRHFSQADTLRWQRTQEGWTVHRSFGEGRETVDGVAVDDPVLPLFAGRSIELECDDGGVVHAVKGYRRLFRHVQRGLDLETWQKVQTMFRPGAAEWLEIQRWNRGRRGLCGVKVRTGESWTYRDLFPSGEGQVAVEGVLRFAGFTEVKGQRGYKLVYSFASAASDEAVPSTDEATRVLDLRSPESAKRLRQDIPMDGELVQVIDPRSGRIFYESLDLRWDLPRPVKAGGTVHIRRKSIRRLEPLHP